jgi:hypothetical protein
MLSMDIGPCVVVTISMYYKVFVKPMVSIFKTSYFHRVMVIGSVTCLTLSTWTITLQLLTCYSKIITSLQVIFVWIWCRNPTLAKCEDETHTPKVGDLESSGTPECLEFDRKGKNTWPWGVLGVIGKVLKFRCPKWPRIGHLDICSPSYGQKKGRESNWQFDSQPLKVGNRPLSDIRI